MRKTLVVIQPSNGGEWRLLGVAPRGLDWKHILLVVGDIPEVRIVPLSLIYSVDEWRCLKDAIRKNTPPPLPVWKWGKNRNWEEYNSWQTEEADKFRRQVQVAHRAVKAKE